VSWTGVATPLQRRSSARNPTPDHASVQILRGVNPVLCAQ